MNDRPTPEQEQIAGYVLGWREGHLAGRIQYEFDHRSDTPSDNDFVTLLDREGFFASRAPIVDAGCGPSPHVGWHLRQQLTNRDVSFIDNNPYTLALHRRLAGEFRHVENVGHDVREYWVLGDMHQEPYLLADKAVIVHGVLPRLRDGERTIEPVTYNALTNTLGRLLAARPHALALYLGAEDVRYPERPSMVLPALDRLGASYRVIENVASADFQPYPGTLVLITP